MEARRIPGFLPSKTVALFAAAAAVSVVALLWTGARLLRQEDALEEQRLADRREAAADRAVAALQQALLAEERRLADAREVSQITLDDALVVRVGPAGITVWPERSILYYPVVSTADAGAPELYADADRLEFVERDYDRAIAALRPLAASRDPAVRVGAQLRLARNLRKAARPDEALAAFGELGQDGGTVSGVPVSLVARGARCLVLEELRRHDQLRKEANELHEALAGGRWRIDRDTYVHYLQQATRWLAHEPALDAERLALTDAVSWSWANLRLERGIGADSSGRRSLRFHETSVTVLWRASTGDVTALVAGPRYQRQRWFAPVFEAPDFGSVRIAVRDRGSGPIYGIQTMDDEPAALRPSSSTTLPWDLVVTSIPSNAASSGAAQRRRGIVLGLSVVIFFVVAASYVASRAVARELAAATLQSDFVSAVSHEFRTPLTSLKQFTEMLVDDGELSEEDRRSYYRAQERATRRLSRLVESLLDFGRMEVGARPYRAEPLDAAELVDTVVQEFRQEGGGDAFSIECHTPGRAIPIDGDREALVQALWNLLDNAVKYSGDNRTVHVETKDGPLVAISIRDHGLGIASADQRRIFEKFSRGSNAVAAGIKGTGLGLAMVSHIVDAHGGTVKLESRPGEGSTFTIELPRGRMGDAKNPDRRG